jgi:hypothetical protein
MDGTHFKQQAAGGSIKRQVVNPDLLEERAKCIFDQEEMQNLLSIPGAKEYYAPMLENLRKHPELKPTPYFLEMTREEQMKWMWELHEKQMKIDPELYFNIEAGLTMPQALTPGIDVTSLHYGMF